MSGSDSGGPSAPFDPPRLLHTLTADLGVAPGASLKIAFSGGMDSRVLLHAAAALRRQAGFRLAAIHVDHGLHADSAAWAAHCRQVCRDLAVPCAVEAVAVRPGRRQSLEAVARERRYQALARHVGPGELLLTAHHQQDQAETVLLMLLRGAGLHGLAAMPPAAPFGGGRLVRPLLGVPRAALADYAQRCGLRWIEDASNRDTRYARSYLRRQVLPALTGRWPGAARTLARSAAHAAEAAAVLDALAADDLARCARPYPGRLPLAAACLSVTELAGLPDARVRSLLRLWARRHGARPPESRTLEELLRQQVHGNGGRVNWPGAETRRYRDTLVLLGRLPAPLPAGPLAWDPDAPLELPECGLRLVARRRRGGGIRCDALAGGGISIARRRGGEICRPAGRAHGQRLKKLFQAEGVPPWERSRLPLLFIGDRLAAVVGLWVCEPFAAGPKEWGIEVGIEGWVPGPGRPPPPPAPASSGSRP